jgi:hypothetical protein
MHPSSFIQQFAFFIIRASSLNELWLIVPNCIWERHFIKYPQHLLRPGDRSFDMKYQRQSSLEKCLICLLRVRRSAGTFIYMVARSSNRWISQDMTYLPNTTYRARLALMHVCYTRTLQACSPSCSANRNLECAVVVYSLSLPLAPRIRYLLSIMHVLPPHVGPWTSS